WFGTHSRHVRESFGGGRQNARSVPEGERGTLGGWEECSMVCIARFRNVGRMGSGGKGGGIFGPGSPTSVGANRIRPPHAFETVSPGWEDIPVAHHLRSLRPCCRDSGRLPDV